MDHRPALPRRVLALLLGVLAALAVLSAGAGTASAATTLESSTPAADEQVATSPTQLQLVFSEAVPGDTTVEVVCSGQPAPVGPLRVEADGRTVTIPVISPIARGKCNVVWQVPQVDGSVSAGNYSFDVLGEAPTETTTVDTTPTPDTGASTDTDTTASSSPSDPPRVGGVLGLSRLVAYLGLTALFGGLVLIAVSWPEGVDYLITLRYLRIVWIFALAGTIGEAAFTTARITGDSIGSSLSPASWGELFDTTDGKVLLARLALVAACGLVAFRPERVLDPASKMFALGLPGLAVATLGISHTDADLAMIGIPAGIIHALAISVWFGGLALLARVVLVGPGEDDLVHAVRGYARSSNAMLMIAVVTGALLTYQLDGGAMFSSQHGRILLLKVVAVAAMAYVGTTFRHFALARLHRADHLDARMAGRLRRAVSVEALFGVTVLALTSWLVATRPPNVDPPGLDTTTYAYVSGPSQGELNVQVMVNPAQVGLNQVRVELYGPTEGVTGLTVRFNPPANAAGVNGVLLTVPLDGAGAALLPQSQGIPLGAPGTWTIEVTADGPTGRLPAASFAMLVTEPNGAVATTTLVSTPATSVVPLQTTTTAAVVTVAPTGETTAAP